MGSLKQELLKLLGASQDEPDTINLGAGRVTKVECARSGEFTAMGGKRVKFTPANLKAIADNFDGPKKIKVSHDAITTATPNYGDIVGLAYDEKRDRLIASTKPNEYLAELNRKGAFERVSLELVPKGDGYALDALSFLGAHDPAITDLEPVAFAAGEERVILCCADEDDNDETLDLATGKPKTPPASTPEQIAAAAAEEKHMEDQKVLLAEKDARIAALEADRVRFVGSDVERFLASDAAAKKIPLPILKAGDLKRVLLAAANLDKAAGKVMLAAADGKETESSIYDGFKAILLALPDKLAGGDTEEIATKKRALADGADSTELPEFADGMTASPDGDARYLAAMTEVNAAKAAGETIDFAAGALRAAARKGAR